MQVPIWSMFYRRQETEWKSGNSKPRFAFWLGTSGLMFRLRHTREPNADSLLCPTERFLNGLKESKGSNEPDYARWTSAFLLEGRGRGCVRLVEDIKQIHWLFGTASGEQSRGTNIHVQER